MLAFLTLLSPINKLTPWLTIALLAVGIYAGAATIVKDWRASTHATAYAAGMADKAAKQEAAAKLVTNALR